MFFEKEVFLINHEIKCRYSLDNRRKLFEIYNLYTCLYISNKKLRFFNGKHFLVHLFLFHERIIYLYKALKIAAVLEIFQHNENQTLQCNNSVSWS